VSISEARLHAVEMSLNLFRCREISQHQQVSPWHYCQPNFPRHFSILAVFSIWMLLLALLMRAILDVLQFFLLFLFCWLMMHDWSCFCTDSISGLLAWNWWEGSGHFCCRIIIAVLTVLERVGDILVSWYVPFTWQQISTALCSYCWWLVAFYNVLRTRAG
jgi:hypothetical protein